MPKSDPTHWTIIGEPTKRPTARGFEWWVMCRCQCGREREVRQNAVVHRQSTSCGKCGIKRNGKRVGYKHGMCNTPEYRAWISMRNRCNDPNNEEYHNYGGRGIKVCPEWNDSRTGFAVFFAHVGPRPSDGHSLDRWPNNESGHYAPGNVRWATKKEQARNLRTCRPIEHDGVVKTVGEWAEIYGIPRGILDTRLKAGWDWDRATTEPVHRNVLTADQVREIRKEYVEGSWKYGAYALAVKYEVSPQTIKRLMNGEIQRYNYVEEIPPSDAP